MKYETHHRNKHLKKLIAGGLKTQKEKKMKKMFIATAVILAIFITFESYAANTSYQQDEARRKRINSSAGQYMQQVITPEVFRKVEEFVKKICPEANFRIIKENAWLANEKGFRKCVKTGNWFNGGGAIYVIITWDGNILMGDFSEEKLVGNWNQLK